MKEDKKLDTTTTSEVTIAEVQLERSHALYSPSTLENLEMCPKFQYPDSESAAAAEGTEMHKALASKDFSKLDEEQTDQVQKVLEFLHAETTLFKKPKEEYETYLEVPGLTYGYADVIISGENKKGEFEYRVYDAKFGRKPVTSANSNLQLACYVCALLEVNPKVSGVYGGIISPRLNDISIHYFTRDDIPKIRNRIISLYKRLAYPFTMPTPQPELCSMCKWVTECPAVKKTLDKLTRVLDIAESFPLDIYENQATPEQRAKAQWLSKVVIHWASVIKENNTKFVQAGGEIPGFQIIQRSSGFKIDRNMIQDAIQILEANNISMDQIMGALSLNIKALADILAEVTDTKAFEWKNRLKNMLASVGSENIISYLAPIKRSRKQGEDQLKSTKPRKQLRQANTPIETGNNEKKR